GTIRRPARPASLRSSEPYVARRGLSNPPEAVSQAWGPDLSEHLVQPEPEHRAPARPDAHGLRQVDPEGRALEEREQRDVDPQAPPAPVHHGADPAPQVGLADVVEDRAEQVAQADHVVEHVLVDVAPERVTPLQRREPDGAPFELGQVQGAEPASAPEP